jgi:hypothetical protein
MNIEYKRLDTLDENFEAEFLAVDRTFFKIMDKAYTTYYGEVYHKERIVDGKAIIYLAFADGELVGASYVKRNLRRGGTAVHPEKYRRLGLAEGLIRLSLADFPKQYSILSKNLEHSHKMLALMQKLNFKKAESVSEVKTILGEQFSCLSNFRYYDGYLIFDRESTRRNTRRENLTLMHTFYA